MAANDSLADINKDLKEAVQFCMSSGLSSKQIAEDASSLLSLSQNSSANSRVGLRSWTKAVFVVAVAVAVVAFLVQNRWTFRWICVAGKSLELKILPYWDWTSLYREECVIPNPYMVIAKLTEDDCEVCESFQEVDILHGVSTSEVTDDYLFDNTPFIVTDATQGWKAFEEFNYDSLKKLYTTHEVMRSHTVCDYTGEETFADMLSSTEHSFHTFWTNCKLAAVKTFRGYYQRPYFLPPMVESALENFVAFSSGLSNSSAQSEDDEFLECYTSGDLTWFAQIRGSYRIQLRPKAPCDHICSILEVVLQEGQTVVLTNEMWELWFAQSDDLPAIAIGSMGDWDS